MHIKEYIKLKEDSGATNIEIAEVLGVCDAMVSSYKKKYVASLNVAKEVYKAESIVLHPFSEEALKYEIEKDKEIKDEK